MDYVWFALVLFVAVFIAYYIGFKHGLHTIFNILTEVENGQD